MTTQTMVYKFKDRAVFRPEFNEEQGAERLGSLLRKHKRLTRDLVKADGNRQDSPLYPAFTHDAAEALEIVQTHEADYLLRQFVTVEIKDDGTRREFRAVVPVFVERDDEQRRYVSTAEAMANEDYRRQVIQSALSEFLALRRKWAELTELAAVFEAIDQLTLPEAA